MTYNNFPSLCSSLFPCPSNPQVTIGDDAGVDDASLIAHINTRGIFRLNPLNVGRSLTD